MADNTILPSSNAGGDTIATDDIAGVKYPRSKISLGADGAATDAVGGAGAVGADTQRVTLGSDDPAVVALQLLDNAVSGAGFNVTQFAGAAVPIGAGVEATAVRVTLATDSTGVVSIDDNGGSITVDGTFWQATQPVSIAAAVTVQDGGGSLTIDGSVSVSGAVDTELTTADLDTGAGTDTRAVVGLVLAASGGGLLVGSANPMPVSDNGGSITIDGSVSVTGTVTVASHDVTNAGTFAVQAAQSGAWNVTNISGTISLPTGAATSAKQDTGNTSLATIAGAVAGTEVQVDVLTMPTVAVTGTFWQATQPVSLASVPSHEVTIAAAQTLATVTTVSTVTNVSQLGGAAVPIGAGTEAAAIRVTLPTDGTGLVKTEGDAAHDAVDLAGTNPVKIGAKAHAELSTITLVADDDRTNLHADIDGVLVVRPNFPTADILTDATSNTDGASTASGIFTATASTRSCITGFQVFRTDAGTTPIYIDFRDGAAGAVLWRAVLPPNGGANSPAYCGPCLFRTSANTALAYDVSAATTTVYINVSGYKSKV